MLREIDNFFLKLEEPHKSTMLFLRDFIPSLDSNITEEWKYKLPFYYYNGKMCCYLWIHKKHKQPYIGFVNGHAMNHPGLLQEKRARMKILLIEPDKDIPIKKLKALLLEAFALARQ